MRNFWGFIGLLSFAAASLSPIACNAQSESGVVLSASNAPSAASAEPAPGPAKGSSRTTSKIGIGFKASTLGAGIEVATPLGSKLNLRGGFNAFQYSGNYSKDGINYTGDLRLRSGEAHLDWFPFGGGFHLSPGALIYDGNQVTANAAATGGQTFTLNNISYTSNAANPVTGTGKLYFNKVAPTFLVGFGNLIPRSGRHWSVMAEAGVAYQGSPHATLNLTGTACPGGINCANVATDPGIQANVQAQQTKLNNDLSVFKFYPILSLGFGFNF